MELSSSQLLQLKRKVMSCKGESAERRFWRTPELVEKLLPLLDARSISRLAQVHQLTVELLQAASFWNDLVRRTCPYDEISPDQMDNQYEFCNLVQDTFQEQKRAIKHLIKLLKKMEDPDVFLLQLLHVICDRFPSVGVRELWDDKPVLFQLSCPCKTSHSVSHLGFMLLEEVEEALGTAEQKVEKVSINHLREPWLSALSSRASRQHERWKWWKQVERVDADRFVCSDTWDLKNFLSLLHKCQKMVLEVVEIQEDLGPRGWANLAQAFPLLHKVHFVHSDREDMLGAKREDLKTIWNALNIPSEDDCVWSVHEVVGGRGVEVTVMAEEQKEEEWMTLEEILDGTTFNWQKKYKVPEKRAYDKVRV